MRPFWAFSVHPGLSTYTSPSQITSVSCLPIPICFSPTASVFLGTLHDTWLDGSGELKSHWAFDSVCVILRKSLVFPQSCPQPQADQRGWQCPTSCGGHEDSVLLSQYWVCTRECAQHTVSTWPVVLLLPQRGFPALSSGSVLTVPPTIVTATLQPLECFPWANSSLYSFDSFMVFILVRQDLTLLFRLTSNSWSSCFYLLSSWGYWSAVPPP